MERKAVFFYINLRVSRHKLTHYCLNDLRLNIAILKTLKCAFSNICHLLYRMPVVFGVVI